MFRRSVTKLAPQPVILYVSIILLSLLHHSPHTKLDHQTGSFRFLHSRHFSRGCPNCSLPIGLCVEISFGILWFSVRRKIDFFLSWECSGCSLVEVDRRFRDVYCLHHKIDRLESCHRLISCCESLKSYIYFVSVPMLRSSSISGY
jgi:hypothetical protein